MWQVFLIGFTSYLLLGNINLGIFELSSARRYWLLAFLLVAALLSEFVYAYFLIGKLEYLHQHDTVSVWVSVAVFLVFLILGIWNLLHRPAGDAAHQKSILKRASLAIFFHPQQIPFWLIWGSYLVGQGLNVADPAAVVTVALVNVVGAGTALVLYSVLGSRMVEFAKRNRILLGRVTGIICLVLAGSEAAGWIF
jgi:hypothetical protein